MRGRLVLLLVVLACAQNDREERPEAVATHSDSAAVVVEDSVALIDGTAGWYDRRRVLDATGDGVPDTLQLIARGPTADSLVVLLIVRRQGDSSIVAAWRSDYDFVDPPDELRVPGPTRDSTIRARYDRVLRDAAVESFSDSTLTRPWVVPEVFFDCEGNAQHCVMLDALARAHPAVRLDSLAGLPFDTVEARRVVADLSTRNLVTLTFSCGYESTESVVWSPVIRRFITVFACC